MKKVIFDNYVITSEGHIYKKDSNLEISQHINSSNRSTRLRVHLTVSKGNRLTFCVHKLVVQTFVKDYNEKTDEIIFIDGDFMNCSLNNLKIDRNVHIVDLPNKKTNEFFEKQNVYGMINHFLSKNKRPLDLKKIFDYDDLVQYLITYVHRKTNIYLLKYKDKQAYSTFVYKLLDTLFKSQIYKEVNKYGSIIQLKQNTFDHELNPLFIDFKEAYQSNIFESRT